MRGGEVLPVTRESNASVQATQLFSSPPRLPEPTLVEEAVRERLFGLSAVEVLSMDKSKEALREKSKLVGAELERRVLRLLIEEGYRVVQNNVIVKDVNGNRSEIDVVALKRPLLSSLVPSPFLQSKWLQRSMYVECKHYSSSHNVILDEVAKFSSVLQQNRISARNGLFVTTSDYVPRARHVGVRTLNGRELRAWEARLRTRRFLLLGWKAVTLPVGTFLLCGGAYLRYERSRSNLEYLARQPEVTGVPASRRSRFFSASSTLPSMTMGKDGSVTSESLPPVTTVRELDRTGDSHEPRIWYALAHLRQPGGKFFQQNAAVGSGAGAGAGAGMESSSTSSDPYHPVTSMRKGIMDVVNPFIQERCDTLEIIRFVSSNPAPPPSSSTPTKKVTPKPWLATRLPTITYPEQGTLGTTMLHKAALPKTPTSAMPLTAAALTGVGPPPRQSILRVHVPHLLTVPGEFSRVAKASLLQLSSAVQRLSRGVSWPPASS